MLPCRHCNIRPGSRPRYLCWMCAGDPVIRERYPKKDAPCNHRGHGATYRGALRLPAMPTTALPGTEQKIEVLRERARRGELLFHPEDARRSS